MGCVHSIANEPKSRDMYLDPAGTLRLFDPSVPVKHIGSEELSFVSSVESKGVKGGDEFYVISVDWLGDWIKFAKGVDGVDVLLKKIDNSGLIDPQDSTRLRATARFKKEYRVVARDVWNYYFERYGGGPAIVFYVPIGFSEESYRTGDWIKAIVLAELVTVVNVQHTVGMCVPCTVRNPLTSSELNAENDMKLAANLLVGNLAKSKFEEAKKLDGEINAGNAEAIGALMARDMGKAKMAEANALNAEVNESNATAIASMMANNLAVQKMEEAKRKENEANKAAADAIANQLAGDMANQKLKAAQQAEQKEREEQEKRIMESFKSMGAKMRFKAALANGKLEVACDAAASMLQGAWRGKLAHRKALQIRAEKQRLREEAYSKKLQGAYRARLARRRVIALREEKRKLLEEAMAIKLQCVWKCKKARRKVSELKARRQALREEGCAIMLQSSWRCRKAYQRVQRLKMEKQRLLEDASALLVQSRWRIIQAKRRTGALKEQKQARIRRENISAVALESRARRFLAKKAFMSKQLSYGYVVRLVIESASNVNIADLNSSDPYVVAAGLVNGRDGRVASIYKTKVISNSLNPVWNEDCIISGLRSAEDVILLTMFDKDVVGKDDFLGQNALSLKAYPALWSGHKVDLNLDIGSFEVPLKSLNGDPIAVNGSETPGKGTIRLSLRSFPFAYSMCGWMYRLSHGIMSATWKRRYVVLLEKRLLYFDDPAELNVLKGSIECAAITAIKEETIKGVNHFSIFYGAGKEKWDIRFVEEDTPDIVAMWKRKISRSCSRLTSGGINAFQEGKHASAGLAMSKK